MPPPPGRTSSSRPATAAFAQAWRALGADHTVTHRDLQADPPPHLPHAALHRAPSLRTPEETAAQVAGTVQEELLAELLAADVLTLAGRVPATAPLAGDAEAQRLAAVARVRSLPAPWAEAGSRGSAAAAVRDHTGAAVAAHRRVGHHLVVGVGHRTGVGPDGRLGDQVVLTPGSVLVPTGDQVVHGVRLVDGLLGHGWLLYGFGNRGPTRPAGAENRDRVCQAAPVTSLRWLPPAAAWATGTALHPAGAVLGAGLVLGSLVTTGSPAAGARIADGLLWGAGPENSVLALAASGAAALFSRERELTAAEHDWAAAELLGCALPRRERLVVTDTIGAGGRPFVFPRWDGAITVNLGPELYADPVGTDPHTFLHELVHTCQVHAAPSRRAWVTTATAAQVRHTAGRDAYAYDLPVRPLAEYGLEQQAQLLADWWRGSPGRRGRPVPRGALRGHTRRPKDPTSPWAACVDDLRASRL